MQYEVSIAPGSRFPLGVTSVTYFGKDPSKNQDHCDFSVIVLDLQPPLITCPGDVVRVYNSCLVSAAFLSG